MIIASADKYMTGDRVKVNLESIFGEITEELDQPAIIIRESTFEELKVQEDSQGRPLSDYYRKVNPDYYYYEVLTD